MTEPRWSISTALPWEIDYALSLIFSGTLHDLIPPVETLREDLSADWVEQGRELLSEVAGDFFSCLGLFAIATGVLDGDYTTLTLAFRELTADELAQHARDVAAEHDLELAGDGPVETLQSLIQGCNEDPGIFSGDAGRRRLRAMCELCVDVTRDGEMHSAFWHWLDRFYYESYRSWRASREEFMESERSRAESALDGVSGEGFPDTEWLETENPLGRDGVIRQSVVDDARDVVFWVEPFGMFDAVDFLPGAILVSFGRPGEMMDALRDRGAEIAGRLKIISDPTRLTILRLVRQLEVDNSEIAELLDVSHPTVSVHIKHLREAGFVESRREGRRLLHRVDTDAVSQLLAELEGFLGMASPRSDR